MSKSTSIVSTSSTTRPTNTVARRTLKMGDVFSRPKEKNGNLYMHTGVRTKPPSAGATRYGSKVIGYQSIVVKGTIKVGEDGARFTDKGDTTVLKVGTATVALNLTA